MKIKKPQYSVNGWGVRGKNPIQSNSVMSAISITKHQDINKQLIAVSGNQLVGIEVAGD